MKTRDIWGMHRRSLISERRSSATIAFYEAGLKKWEKFLDFSGKADDLEKLSRVDLQEYQLWLREKEGLSPGAEHAVLRALRAIALWGENEEILSRTPFKRFRMPSKPQERLPGIQPEHVSALLGEARKGPEQPLRDVAILMMLFDTGLRVSELIALTVDDVDTEKGVVNVRAETTKRQKSRVVPIGVRTARALLGYQRRERRPGLPTVQYLFVSYGPTHEPERHSAADREAC